MDIRTFQTVYIMQTRIQTSILRHHKTRGRKRGHQNLPDSLHHIHKDSDINSQAPQDKAAKEEGEEEAALPT